MRQPLAAACLAAFTAVMVAAAAAAAAPVSGTFSIDGTAYAIGDVSAQALPSRGPDDPAWQLVFSEQPHEHTAAGRERALDGDHGVAFVVEVLPSGEGHLFVLYQREPGATSAYPSSFPWPAVSGFAADGSSVRGKLANNPDFPYQQIRFELTFAAPVLGR